MKIPQTRKEANGPNIYTRQIQQEVIKLNEENIEKARDLIEEGKTRRSPRNLHPSDEESYKSKKRRYAQIWFDQECYKERKENIACTTHSKNLQTTGRPNQVTRKEKELQRNTKKEKRRIYRKTRKKASGGRKIKSVYSIEKENLTHNRRNSHTKMGKGHFSDLLNKQDMDRAYDLDKTKLTQIQEPITSQELRKAINGGNNKKSAGPRQHLHGTPQRIARQLRGTMERLDEQMHTERRNSGEMEHSDPKDTI
ncbi:hypothetical protein L9F63_021018 [Diploptera punctata]|uniref:Uncharacterized protein n=1 Tax=Diploptera punctata TaxID=6984 RepID=A0AAD7ZQC7_DIPPU|nr:hypothetical protein L9F63_021018 [Diploptera punctata]